MLKTRVSLAYLGAYLLGQGLSSWATLPSGTPLGSYAVSGTAVLLAGVLRGAEEKVQNPRTSPDDVAAGAATYRSHCSPCHGLNGKGGRGPDLTTSVYFHGDTDFELLTNISEGIPGTEMPALFYSPDRVWQVVAYLRSLTSRGQDQPKGNIVRGGELFRSKGCLQCHRIDGKGSRLGPDLTEIGKMRSSLHLRTALTDPQADVRQRYWVVRFTDAAGRAVEGFLMNEDTYTVQFMDLGEGLHSLQKSELQNYRIEKISKMPSFRSALTAEDLDDLVAFLAAQRPKGARQ
ncbi:MAG: c-type cytochrome [Acidobacteriota bacterium]